MIAMYPCESGMPGSGYRGLHRFEATAHGICCVLCGAKPPSADSSNGDDRG